MESINQTPVFRFIAKNTLYFTGWDSKVKVNNALIIQNLPKISELDYAYDLYCLDNSNDYLLKPISYAPVVINYKGKNLLGMSFSPQKRLKKWESTKWTLFGQPSDYLNKQILVSTWLRQL